MVYRSRDRAPASTMPSSGRGRSEPAVRGEGFALAKLAPPRLATVHPRERLFGLLDGARSHPVVWICGSPGIGKTTLAASYLEARTLPGPWYQVDAGDGDPAAFFYYLREAVPSRQRAALPLLTPEYLPDLAGFTRRFFRAFFARLPAPAAVVFDNFQEAPAASPLGAIIRDAVAELPRDTNLIVISRVEPPAECARLQANRHLALLGWDELRLTLAESEAIVALHHKGRVEEAATLHECAGGWAAGLTLLLESEALPAAVHERSSADGTRVVFDYFATEVFDRAPEELRALWSSTAWLPRFTASMATELSGIDGAARLLEQLCRERYFTYQQAGTPPSYQYHALFQEFLCKRVGSCQGAAGQRDLARRSAALLERHGDFDAALAAYRQAGDWEHAQRVILTQAPRLFAVGRVATIKEWIGTMPATMAEASPWLKFWMGSCLAQSGASAAGRQALEQAYDCFSLSGDLVGQAQAAAAVIDTYFMELNEHVPLDRWIDVLEALFAQDPVFPSPGMELRVRASLLVALAYRRPQNCQAARTVERVWQLCRSEVSAAEKLQAATQLVNYLAVADSAERTREAVIEFSPLGRSPETTPMQRITWAYAVALSHLNIADFAAVRQVISEAHELANQNGLVFILDFLRMFRLWGELPAGDVDSASQALDDIGGRIDHARHSDVGLYHFMRSWVAFLQRRHDAALDHAQIAATKGRHLGMVGPVICCLGGYAQALAETGAVDRALEIAREATSWVNTPGTGIYRFNALLVEGEMLRRLGRQGEYLATLREALTVGRVGGYFNCPQWRPEMMSPLCVTALEAGIEIDYVRQLIRRRGLAPPSVDIEHWPWPVSVHTLGRFVIFINDERLKFPAKAPKKPLELLKAVIVSRGRGASIETLCAELWPDLCGDAAANAFHLALHRLRKLLRAEDALSVEDGKLSFDAQLIWVDAWAFERLVGQAETLARSVIGQDPGPAQALASRMLELYGGHFLSEEQAPWAIAHRERLRSKFLRAGSHLALALEEAQRFSEAADLYRRGLELDALAEEFHRGLMRCLAALGRVAEAVDAYRRCRDILSVTLGVEPSAETKAVYRALKG
ncbi:BTAD domain-containing putative transcriptional regulator [Burkholderia sp. PU8-34]